MPVLPSEHRAGRVQPFHHGGVVLRHVILEHAGAAGGAHASASRRGPSPRWECRAGDRDRGRAPVPRRPGARARRAGSAMTVMKALSGGFRRSMRASAAAVSSAEDTRRRRRRPGGFEMVTRSSSARNSTAGSRSGGRSRPAGGRPLPGRRAARRCASSRRGLHPRPLARWLSSLARASLLLLPIAGLSRPWRAVQCAPARTISDPMKLQIRMAAEL